MLGDNQRARIRTMLDGAEIPPAIEAVIEDAQRRCMQANGGQLTRADEATIIAMMMPKEKRKKPDPGASDRRLATKEAKAREASKREA